MMKRLLFLYFLFTFNFSFSQQNYVTDHTVVSILTVGTADESHSLYGHTALRIKDTQTHTDVVYNYGMFDFATANFALKFIKGDLQYFAAAYPYADFEYNYRFENRSIYEQVLNLSFEEKQSLYLKLNTTLYSENKFYTYKFIDRNCTTKVIDLVNDVLVNHPIVKKNGEKKSYRSILFPYVENHFYQQLGINIIFGQKVDRQATTLFLPLDLYQNLEKISYKNKPLVSETNILFEANRTTPFSFWDSIYSYSCILMLFVVLNTKITNAIYFFILGIIGLLFTLIGLHSFHQEVLWNYNILLFNPIFLVLPFFIFKEKTIWIKRISWMGLFLIGIYIVFLIDKIHLKIMLPMVISTTIILFRIALKSSD